jgi:hypothetical protein
MIDIEHKIKVEDIIKGGATKIKDNCSLFRLGNQRYVVYDKVVISSYLIKYDPKTRKELINE